MLIDGPAFDEEQRKDRQGTWDKIQALEHAETVRVRGPQGPGDKIVRDPGADEQRARDEFRRLSEEADAAHAAARRAEDEAAREAMERLEMESARAQEPAQ